MSRRSRISVATTRAVLRAEDRLDRRYISQTGRTSIEPISAAGIFAAYVQRLVDVLALEDVVAAELLLRLRERPVGDERLAVADADGRRGGGRLEPVGGHELAAVADLLRERAVALDAPPRRRRRRAFSFE